MRLDRYLERIGLDGSPKPDLASLRALHRAHLRAIPYENLDVQLGRPVALDIPAIYDKIVRRGRGGWCYEMNGLLGWALKEIGFRVTRATGAVMREIAGDPTVGNHLVLRVDLDGGTWLADVGFGDGPQDPIAIAPGEFSAHGFVFGLSRLDDDWWRLRNHPAGAASSFDFNLAPADETLLAANCEKLQSAPDSIFVQNVFCFRFTPDGLVNLRGRVLRTVTPRSVSEHILASADEFRSAIAHTLGLNVPEAASLWPRVCARHAAVFGQHGTA